MWKSPFSWLWLPIVLLTYKTKAESVTVLLVTGRKMATIGGNEGVFNLTREAVITTEVRLYALPPYSNASVLSMQLPNDIPQVFTSR